MVRIIDYLKRTNAEGEDFFVLVLQGGLEIVKSQETGRNYATSKTANLSSVFDENTCKSCMGLKTKNPVSMKFTG
jgi:hypothetical protein